jgi:hypothetical protein
VALTSGVAIASLIAAGSATASTPKTTNRGVAAAGYLARHLAGPNHDHYIDTYTLSGKTYKSADDGETADAVLSIDASGSAQTGAGTATKWLEADSGNYLTGSGYTPTGVYPGAAAKLLLVATAQHVNPAKFGTADLITDLENAEGAGTGAAPGQYQNTGDPGSDSSSNLDQALAVLALASSPVDSAQPDHAAVAFLAGQQCTDGGWELAIRADASTACTAASEDVDTSAYAIQALLAAGDRHDANQGLGWLNKQRNTDGGWGETPGVASEANSTSIAVEAEISLHGNAHLGLLWLHNQQQGCHKGTVAPGAIRYQGTKHNAVADQRATSQAGVALANKWLGNIDRTGASSAAAVFSC